jgi:hypothetical protein
MRVIQLSMDGHLPCHLAAVEHRKFALLVGFYGQGQRGPLAEGIPHCGSIASAYLLHKHKVLGKPTSAAAVACTIGNNIPSICVV